MRDVLKWEMSFNSLGRDFSHRWCVTITRCTGLRRETVGYGYERNPDFARRQALRTFRDGTVND